MSAGRYASHSPPTRIMASHAAEVPQYSRHVPGGQGNDYTSPRAQLPSMHRLPSNPSRTEDDEMLNAKRRRIDDPIRIHTANPTAEGDADEQHRIAFNDRYSNAARSVAPRSSGVGSATYPSSSSSSGHLQGAQEPQDRFAGSNVAALDDGRYELTRRGFGAGDESSDANLPLARRRGDAAQAKASRLHIDTGYSTESQESILGTHLQERDRLGPSSLAHGATRSAPPHKMTFAERESALPPSSSSYDLRDDRQLPPFANRASSGYYQRSPSTLQFRRGEGPDSTDPGQGWESINAQSRRELGPPSGPHGAAPTGGPLYRGTPTHGGVATPLTAARASAFVPQTATLPSPAYHSTHLGRQVSAGSGHGPASGGPPSSGNGAGASLPPGPHSGPRTAGLSGSGQPLTARLPDHMRSPPSSKTQFLSLFSNFYDSLSDSRTLKATLEDQVRRSNTLLQTLQRSARVLELTVDRRLQEERAVWEAKVEALEARCRRLEDKTRVGSPTPVSHSHSRNGSVQNGDASLALSDAQPRDSPLRVDSRDDPRAQEASAAAPNTAAASPRAQADREETAAKERTPSDEGRDE